MVLVIGATACSDSGGSDAATCQGKSGQTSSTKAVGGETADGAGKKVGIVLDIGGKNDKSFNQAAAAGLTQAGKDFGVQTKLLEPNKDGSNREELLRSLADDGYQYIIGNGFLFAESLKKVARHYPDIRFAHHRRRIVHRAERDVARVRRGAGLLPRGRGGRAQVEDPHDRLRRRRQQPT